MVKIINQKSLTEILKKIHTAYQLQNEYYLKSCEQIITIGKCLLDIDEQLKRQPNVQIDFLEKLPFSTSLASKYKQIAKHPVLSNAKNLKQLPHSLSTLYELSKSSEEELLNAIKTGEVSLQITRSGATKFAIENPKVKSAGKGAPIKSNVFVSFSQVKISSDCDEDEQDEILQELIKIKERYPSFSLKISKDVSSRYKEKLFESARNALNQIIESQNSEKQKLSNLLSNAIFEARKNKDVLPKDFKWRQRLSKEVGIDVTQEVRVSQLYKIVRSEGIITRYTPIAEIDPVASVWVQVINYCEGDKGAFAKLKEFSEKSFSKPSAKTNKAQELAIQMIGQIETL